MCQWQWGSQSGRYFIVGMPVMGVMHMGVFMIQFLVFMVVFVMLRGVKPDAKDQLKPWPC